MVNCFSKAACILLFALAMDSHAGCLQNPAAGYHITSPFGNRFHPIKQKMIMHKGVDFGVPFNTVLPAADSGVITRYYYSTSGGMTVYLQSDSGYQIRYLDLNKSGVAVGQRVSAGQGIAYSGGGSDPAISTGPHLHLEVREGEQIFDPLTKICGGNSGSPPVMATTAPPNGSAPSHEAVVAGNSIDFDSAPDFSVDESESAIGLMASETARRIFNPDWLDLMASCGADKMRGDLNGAKYTGLECKKFYRLELLSITALRAWIKSEQANQEERINALRSSLLIDQTRSSGQAKLDQLKSRAFSANVKK